MVIFKFDTLLLGSNKLVLEALVDSLVESFDHVPRLNVGVALLDLLLVDRREMLLHIVVQVLVVVQVHHDLLRLCGFSPAGVVVILAALRSSVVLVLALSLR